MNKDFKHIVALIQQSRGTAYQAVNAELVNLYWQVGGYISQRVASTEWGKAVVEDLANFISRTEPSVRGFSDKNLWRMKQFYETYKDSSIIVPVRRELERKIKLAPARRELKHAEKNKMIPTISNKNKIKLE